MSASSWWVGNRGVAVASGAATVKGAVCSRPDKPKPSDTLGSRSDSLKPSDILAQVDVTELALPLLLCACFLLALLLQDGTSAALTRLLAFQIIPTFDAPWLVRRGRQPCGAIVFAEPARPHCVVGFG